MLKKTVKWSVIAVLWLSLWQIAALSIGNELLLPSPVRTLVRLGELGGLGRFWISLFHSLVSVLIGIFAAVILGVIFGSLTARFSLLHDFLSPLLTIIKTTPVASFIILALIWITRVRLPAFISGLMVLPIVWTNVEEGLLHRDKKILEMARVFRFSRLKIWWHITVPAVLPYFAAALRSSLGLAWKAGVAAEVLATPKNTIGQSLFEAKVLLETTDVFAWTLTIILLSLLLEKAILAGLTWLLKKTHTGGLTA